jgi:hypothetical protein
MSLKRDLAQRQADLELQLARVKDARRKQRTRSLIQFGAYFERCLPEWSLLPEPERRACVLRFQEKLSEEVKGLPKPPPPEQEGS